MISCDERRLHDEVWLVLPWLATGRLSGNEREMAEEHVRHCGACEQELAVQHLMGKAFTEPDRVTYAPGPSFRKLMDRIDSEANRPSARRLRPVGRIGSMPGRLSRVSLWRPPGLAWAASFLLLFGITGLLVTAYRWSQPEYRTVTDPTAATPNVIHIALDRSVPIGEIAQLLQRSGARIVEGPGNTGILGVTLAGNETQTSARNAHDQLRALSERLRSDPRVLWVQPLAADTTAADQRASRAPDKLEH